MCVKNVWMWVSLFWICALRSSASVFCGGCNELHCCISRWSGLCSGGAFFSIHSPYGDSWVSHLGSVCRVISCTCLFELNCSGFPKASQHCSHNQSRHPKICYITFYFKKSVSHQWWCIIFNMNKKLQGEKKSTCYPQRVEKHKVELKQLILAAQYELLALSVLINMGRHLPAGEKEGRTFLMGPSSWGDEPRKWKDLTGTLKSGPKHPRWHIETPVHSSHPHSS